MTALTSFSDIEGALITVFSDLATCGSVTPPTLQTNLPFVRFKRIGGNDDFFTDTALVSVDAFDANVTDARTLGEAIRQRLIAPGALASATGVELDSTVTATAPNEVPWSNDQTIHRFTATYRVTARRS